MKASLRSALLVALCVVWEVASLGTETRTNPPASLGGSSQEQTRLDIPKDACSVDLRPSFEKWGLTRRTQGKRNTCSVFTVAGALEFAAARHEGHGERLSVEFLNWASNRVTGENDDGSFFSDLWRAFARYGACSEQVMPYHAEFDPSLAPTPDALTQAKICLTLSLRPHWIKEWDIKTGLTIEHLRAIKNTLDQGWPVCAGLRWPRKPDWADGALQMCPAEAVYDGHSVLLVGYHDDPQKPGGGTFLFRNTSGDGRDGAMLYAYARAYMNDALWIDFDPTLKPSR